MSSSPSTSFDPTELLDGVGWTARGDFKAEEKRQPFFPRLKHIMTIIPLVFRFLFKMASNWWNGEGIFINILKQHRHRPHTGVPIGGIGCGSIGRDFRGGFNRFSLVPGMKEIWIGNVKANQNLGHSPEYNDDQFIVTVRSVTGQLLTQKLLTCAPFRNNVLSSWKEQFNPRNVRYRGLFPRSWTEFSLPELGLCLVCEQISPVVKDDYKDSSLPVTSFVWHVVNKSTSDYRVSISFTWRNGTGHNEWAREGIVNVTKASERGLTGLEMEHSIRGMPLTYGIYARKVEKKQTISMTTFNPRGDGKNVWNSLKDDGNFENTESIVEGEKEVGVAVCAEAKAFSESNVEIEFVLVWHMPEIDFGRDSKLHRRRYTRYFGDKNAPVRMASYALSQRENWQGRIAEWQGAVTGDRSLPEWYRSTLFNELYYIVDGSVSWVEFEEGEKGLAPHTEKHFHEYGRFGYMESWEYLMINTYDVHFYAAAALLENWPQLQVGIQLDFSEQLNREDLRVTKTLMDGDFCIVKKMGRMPHDLGHPIENPWDNVNTYEFHDTGEWKDLNLKFVLTSLRDYERAIRDNNEDAHDILTFLFDRSMEIISTGKQLWDKDDDGMIENSGFADQTYDVWTMTGTSAYCGSLWLGALEAARRMAVALGRKTEAASLHNLLDRAKGAFIKKLWNGKYFDFDETSRSIMADQLCGVWFMGAHDGNREGLLVDEDKINSALDVVYANNVKGFGGGQCGAANGMTHDGKVDTTAIQSEEMWTGTTYALASFYALMGDKEKCFAVAEGVHTSCWKRAGLQFQTPEAVFEKKYYRAIGYMRPLAIWNIHSVLESIKMQKNNNLIKEKSA